MSACSFFIVAAAPLGELTFNFHARPGIMQAMRSRPIKVYGLFGYALSALSRQPVSGFENGWYKTSRKCRTVWVEQVDLYGY